MRALRAIQSESDCTGRLPAVSHRSARVHPLYRRAARFAAHNHGTPGPTSQRYRSFGRAARPRRLPRTPTLPPPAQRRRSSPRNLPRRSTPPGNHVPCSPGEAGLALSSSRASPSASSFPRAPSLHRSLLCVAPPARVQSQVWRRYTCKDLGRILAEQCELLF